jgi:hypothetical protein
MNTPAKLILGAVATGCIAIGVAAQTGTLRMSQDTSSGAVSGVQQSAPATTQPAETPPLPTPPADVARQAPASRDGEEDDEDDGD